LRVCRGQRNLGGVSYSVLFQEFPLDHLDAAAAAVSQVYGIPNYDARARVRKGWGFLEHDVAAERATQIADGLTALGVPVRAVANSELRTPADPQVMIGFSLDAIGFTPHPQDPRTPVVTIPWAELRILAAGGFAEEVLRREAGSAEPSGKARMVGLGIFLVTGLPVGLMGGKKKEAKPVKTSRFITFGELITRAGAAWYFNPESFDFAGLGAAKQLNVAGNFRELITAVGQASPARLNHGAALLRDHKPLTLANYQTLHDFETEISWMLNTPGR
jgi:hypothetical protein